MPTDTSLAATLAAAAAAPPDARDRDPRWIRINGQYHQLPAASTNPSDPAPVIERDEVVLLAFGEKTSNALVSWQRFGPQDDARNPSEYGTMRLTSAPLIRKPGYRFAVTRAT